LSVQKIFSPHEQKSKHFFLKKEAKTFIHGAFDCGTVTMNKSFGSFFKKNTFLSVTRPARVSRVPSAPRSGAPSCHATT
jgi:hypothetical protein